MCRESRGAPSAREMTIGQASPSPKRADKGWIATYRAGLRLDLSSVAPCAAVVGNREEPSGKSRVRCFTPAAIHAACEDYRASFSIDDEHDVADRHRKIRCPTLVLWGLKGACQTCFDIRSIWKDRAKDVVYKPLDTNHYLAEEDPDAFRWETFLTHGRHTEYGESRGISLETGK